MERPARPEPYSILAVGAVILTMGLGSQAEPPVPRQYVCYRAATPIQIDGALDEEAWAAAPWTEDFIDIQGDGHATPRHRTRVKMLWDESYFYVAAEMEETHLWATLTERDSVIYRDNDFEVFIDPDGDTHAYYELEVNALGTEWDLMLLKPYRDGGPAIDGWDIAGLKTGIRLDGSLNDPGDVDSSWSVELALPWDVLEEAAPGGRPPRSEEQWRVNFSRVQWQLAVVDGRYEKRRDADGGEPLPEDNWVWSPQGAIDMHRPERWGRVQFSDTVAGAGSETFRVEPDAPIVEALRALYYEQRRYNEAHGRYAADMLELLASRELANLLGDTLVRRLRSIDRPFSPELLATATGYEIRAPGTRATHHIRDDGRAWRSAPREQR